MKVRNQALLLLMSALLVPLNALAFSFGTFTPGDTIVEIELSAAVSTGVVLDTGALPSDPSDDTLTFESSVSTITMASGAVFSPTLGDVLVSSTVMPIAGSELFLSTIIGAEFSNGIVADISITDVGPGGAGLLLDADYIGSVTFTASQFFSGFPITGSLSGDFTTLGGDVDFTTAFGPAGNFFSELAGWQVGGTAPSDLCELTDAWLFGFCLGTPADFANFTANPTTTITPIAVPEPTLLWLLGVAALGAFRRR